MKIGSIHGLQDRVLRKLSKHKVVDKPDPEWLVAARLCHRERLALDVGADAGNFAATVAPYARGCVAFEPRVLQALRLVERFRQEQHNIEVQPVALSNKAGVVQMRILVNDPGRSTIDDANTLDDPDGSPVQSTRVPTLRLDDYRFRDVGLLKIDAEGHELAVLQGAVATIRESRPSIYIEVEDRHSAGANAAVREFLLGLEYEGFFFLDGKAIELRHFDAGVHQNPANISGWKNGWRKRGIYVNNFFYLPRGRASELVEHAAAVGLS